MGDVGIGIHRVIQDADGESATVTDGRLDVNATLGVGSSTFTTYAQDTATTSAQTITALIGGLANLGCKEIIIQADFDNASFIMIGDGGVTSDDTEGIRLHAGDMLTLPVSSTANVSIDGSASSQKVNVAIIR